MVKILTQADLIEKDAVIDYPDVCITGIKYRNVSWKIGKNVKNLEIKNCYHVVWVYDKPENAVSIVLNDCHFCEFGRYNIETAIKCKSCLIESRNTLPILEKCFMTICVITGRTYVSLDEVLMKSSSCCIYGCKENKIVHVKKNIKEKSMHSHLIIHNAIVYGDKELYDYTSLENTTI